LEWRSVDNDNEELTIVCRLLLSLSLLLSLLPLSLSAAHQVGIPRMSRNPDCLRFLGLDEVTDRADAAAAAATSTADGSGAAAPAEL
jgi:hypothetical protein